MFHIVVLVLAGVYAAGAAWLYERNVLLFAVYIAALFGAGWFLQTDEEKEGTRLFWKRWF